MRAGSPASLAFLLAAWLLAGCSNTPQLSRQVAQPILQDDVCAVCGMYLEASPGPRAEAYVDGHDAPLKFDSTRDFFAYVLQPENRPSLQSLFVQDTARLDWDHPSRAAASFIDARTAYYVAWQPLPGSMGPTLAPFSQRKDAESFVNYHGGEIFRFGDITPQLIALLGYACPDAKGPYARQLQACTRKQQALRAQDLVPGQPSG